MKKLIVLLTFCFTSVLCYSQCNPFYNLSENAEWEMQTYNAKGKPDGKQLNKVSKLVENNNGWVATINSTLYDKKDKELQQMTFDLVCTDGKIEVDLENYIPQQTLESFKNMDMKMEGENLILPEELEVGQKLDDGQLKISGDLPFDITISINDRKVEGRETITVPAGTFEVYKISYTTNIKSLMNAEMKGIEYVARDIGVVKTETFNKKGKLQSYSELTNYKKP